MVTFIKLLCIEVKCKLDVENTREGQPHGILCKKKGMDGYTIWMKKEALYTSGVVGSKTTHMGYVMQELYSK